MLERWHGGQFLVIRATDTNERFPGGDDVKGQIILAGR